MNAIIVESGYRLRREATAHPIPPITDPMGRNWDQPDRHRIAVDAKHALMEEATFNALHEYSTTIPTGVYEGKMWRRHDGIAARGRHGEIVMKQEQGTWLLCWYGPSDEPDRCSINHRVILIA